VFHTGIISQPLAFQPQKVQTPSMKLLIRNYIHSKDFNTVKDNLIEAGMFDEVWEDEKRLELRSKFKPDSMIVAELGDKVVGSVFLADDFYPYVFRLVVKKDNRGKGIGTKLLEEAIKRLKAHGHTEIDVLVNEKSKELKKWYKKLGFKGKNTYRALWKEI
jgi:ribosomal protein S18 acetylase RimI-like enzyme